MNKEKPVSVGVAGTDKKYVGIHIGGEKPVKDVSIRNVIVEVSSGKTKIKPRLTTKVTTTKVEEYYS